MKKLILPLLAVVMMTACTETNPLLGDWKAPFEIPPFEQVLPEHYLPAYIKAMEVHSAEIDAITSNPEPATFENTIAAYSYSGELLSRVSAVFGSASGVKSNDEIKAIARELSPLTSAHYDNILLNEALFARIKEVYDKRDSLGLEPDQMRLLTETYKGFARSGANLSPDKKEELKKINTEIAANQLAFGQNLLKETEWTLLVEDEKDLAGLSEAQIATAAARAQQAGKEGWIFGLDNPSVMPFLQSADNRELRIKMLDAYLNRCNNGNEYDNNEVIKNLIRLRLQKANLLGYEDFAAYVLEDRMARNADAVYALLNQLWTPAIAVAKAELADIEALAAKDGIKEVVAADWRYYFEKSMQSKYNISDEELRPYFKLENVRDGIFLLANKLFGITFEQLDNVPLPHAEAVAYECKEADGTTLGILFMDMFSRPGEKRGGAWCGGFRSQYYEDGKRVLPLVTIVGNFTRPSGDKPALLSTDETNTFFHEFGHALASLLSDVRYKPLGRMTRDFVELPSQIMEHWVFEPELLKEYAKHYETGEIIPAELIEKLDKAGKYGQGFATVEYLAASFLDMDFHVLKSIPEDIEPIPFENKVLGERGLLSQIPSRYRSPYFNHTFGGGYTAGYYSYIWAEVLDCDAYQAFVETGDIFNPEVALKYRKEILEGPGVDEAMKLYVNFRGREPRIEPLLKNRGLK
jgi:peptidyl-dipeptidase Dcp